VMTALRADEEARALAIWRKKFPQPAGSRDERARQGRFLLGRGFSAELVWRIVGGKIDDAE
jgi:regulatory protein